MTQEAESPYRDAAKVEKTIARHGLSVYPTLPEARRLQALASEHFGMSVAALLRRLVIKEIIRTKEITLSQPYPDTCP